MVPAFVEVKEPMLTGAEKLPVASDNWAVKILPAVKVPLEVNVIATVDPGQKGDQEIADVVIVFFAAKTKKRLAPITSEPEIVLTVAVPFKFE